MTTIRTILTLLSLIISAAVSAQEKVEMADTMRSNGRIYVVVAVMLFILLGIVIYLIRLDRKISRLEKGKDI